MESKQTRQNAKWLYVMHQSNLLPESFIFHNPWLCQSKKDIILSQGLTWQQFSQFDKRPGKYTSKSHQVETIPVCK